MQRSSIWMCRLLGVLVACAVLFAPGTHRVASAQDSLAEARSHYQKGTSLFSSGEYKGAIAEYAAADKLAPSALLEFNIALCYDRMGDRAEALRRYRVYLREMPSAKNRGSVEAKVKRLEGEIRQAQEAERKRRAEAAAVAAAAQPALAPAPAPAPVNPEDIVIPRTPPTAPATVPPATPTVATTPATATPAIPSSAPAAVYTPGAAPAPAGPAEASAPRTAVYESNDPDLARVAAIDVAAIRGLRAATGAGASRTDAEATASSGSFGGNTNGQPQPLAPAPADKKAKKPVYKQWWFWAIAVVGTVIVVDMLGDDAQPGDQPNRRMFGTPLMQSGSPATGPLEWRF